MSRPASPDPLAGTDRLLVDGNNLLHALGRGREAGGAMPAATAIGRLRGAVPPAVGIELVLDGAPDRGMRGVRVASGLIVRHAGRMSADELILGLVDEARRAHGRDGGVEAVDNILVVTDDRDLRFALRERGARTARTSWLVGRLGRAVLAAPSAGNRRPPATVSTEDETDDRPRWRPGRGATTKRGNGKRRSAPKQDRPG